ncbi:hypothetical protein EVAR_32362_1 [Eumeta japonica]|uniref:Uncharacterized protein n=1 Tax=Eumeta variegata TaxID=151549 RepID=A0A4C1VIQ6_EUMVA|nr:hypothetical protein EVAR_32362_1 [Eumeta japonica]
MKGPIRPAPAAPKFGVNRYSPVTDWNDDPFGTDVFEPLPQQKKKPPPRPPPPKLAPKIQPDIPAKPSHFNRKPTVLSALLSRRNRPTASEITQPKIQVQPNILPDVTEVNTSKLFPKCEPKNTQTGALIDLSSPPSSPTFTTRSSSDGLSVDSFGSDATTSTNNQHHTGNISQTESGFEDDFDLFLNSRNKEDLLDDVHAIDPFSPTNHKPPISKKPTVNKDYMDLLCDFKTPQTVVLPQTAPTIIRAKPARPRPPENSSILKSTFGNSLPVTNMNINTIAPIKKIGNSFGNTFESTELSWDEDDSDDHEGSPPMPTIPPPPPPPEVFAMEENGSRMWEELNTVNSKLSAVEPILSNYNVLNEELPYGIALYDYSTGHPDDLSFTEIGIGIVVKNWAGTENQVLPRWVLLHHSLTFRAAEFRYVVPEYIARHSAAPNVSGSYNAQTLQYIVLRYRYPILPATPSASVFPKVVQVDPRGSAGDSTGVCVGRNKKWGSIIVSGVSEFRRLTPHSIGYPTRTRGAGDAPVTLSGLRASVVGGDHQLWRLACSSAKPKNESSKMLRKI